MERFPRTQAEIVDHNTSLASDGPAADRSKSRQRSRVTNGTALLPGVDGRSAWMRRCKDIIAAHVSDLGGEDNISAAEPALPSGVSGTARNDKPSRAHWDSDVGRRESEGFESASRLDELPK